RREADPPAEIAGLRRAGEQADAEVARLGDLAAGVRRRLAEAAGQLATLRTELGALRARAEVARLGARAAGGRRRLAGPAGQLATLRTELDELEAGGADLAETLA